MNNAIFFTFNVKTEINPTQDFKVQKLKQHETMARLAFYGGGALARIMTNKVWNFKWKVVNGKIPIAIPNVKHLRVTPCQRVSFSSPPNSERPLLTYEDSATESEYHDDPSCRFPLSILSAKCKYVQHKDQWHPQMPSGNSGPIVFYRCNI